MNNMLYVENLAHTTTEAELRNLFSPHGRVLEVNLVIDSEQGESRGFAFVKMATMGAAQKALRALHGSTVGTQLLRVSEARIREARGGSSGGGGSTTRRRYSRQG